MVGPSLLCESCDRENRLRIDRVVWFGGIHEDRRRTLRHMAEFEKQFPDGAALIQDVHRALAEAFPRVDALHREMRHQSDEAARRLEAARDKGWAALIEENKFAS